MNDMEKQPFEDAFKDAFRDAEIDPVGNVWNNIELELARAESSKMKKRVLFYQMLAAASVAFACCVAGVGYYSLHNGRVDTAQLTEVGNKDNNNTTSTETIQVNPSNKDIARASTATEIHSNGDGVKSQENTTDAIVPESKGVRATENAIASEKVRRPKKAHHDGGEQNSAINTDDQSIAVIESSHGKNIAADRVTLRNEQTVVAATATDKSDGVTGTDKAEHEREVTPIYVYTQRELTFPSESTAAPDPVALMMQRLADRERELAMETKKNREDNPSEKIWTSLGFAAGNFSTPDPSVNSSAVAGIASNKSAATNQAKASGTAYSMGVSVGGKIAERWVIQGGVNYMTQVSDYTTSVAVSSDQLAFFKPASLNEYRSNDDTKYVPTAPYNVNNSLRYISVPVQAGYLVVDRRVGVQVNAGVSTDMFLQNTIDPQGSAMKKTTEGRGEDSPYRPVNFSGLVGTELSYRFADRYRLALNPGIRYPFNSIYKDEVGVDATPLTFDVGLRFRYIFK